MDKMLIIGYNEILEYEHFIIESGWNMKFEDLKLEKQLLKALAEEGYKKPSPIQVQAIPPALEGRDILGCAQTGTGKTAAFALPVLNKLINHKTRGRREIKALILTPTRELALQVTLARLTTYHQAIRLDLSLSGANQSLQPQHQDVLPLQWLVDQQHRHP